MSSYSSADIPHTASTDHRIPRRPRKLASASPQALRIRPFFPATKEADLIEQERDLGIAMSGLVDAGKIMLSRQSGDQLIGLMESALKRDPDDWPTWHAKGLLLRAGGRKTEALAAEETILARIPNQEESLVAAAGLDAELGQFEAARRYLRQATVVSPYNAQYRRFLAEMDARAGEWQDLLANCEQWLTLEPWSVSARAFRVTALLRTGRKDDARTEIEKIRALKPANLAELLQQFDAISK
jgi:tetratricopeptide (TPR) repeat protein